MQNDLISRSELIKRIKTFTNISDSYYQNADILLAEIYNMPTAYSVEKVVDRLTERERNFDNTGIAMESLTSDGRANLSDFADKALTKLADYEDAEEQWLLVKVECHCKDCKHVDFAGCNNGTCYCYMNECYMNEDDFCKYAERYKEEAEKKLESMKGENSMEDIKTNIDKIVDELNFYMRQYPNTYSEVKHLLFEIEEQEQEIRNKVIDEFASKLIMHFSNWKMSESHCVVVNTIEQAIEGIKEIAKQMKEV